MATPPNPLSGSSGATGGAPGSPPPGALPGASPPGASPGANPSAGGAPLPQKLARLAMDAQAIASESPETAPMMREIANQVRMAMMKMIQQRQQTQQATPPI